MSEWIDEDGNPVDAPDDDEATRRAIRNVAPYDPEAERMVLGAMLLSREAIEVASGIVGAEDFYSAANGALYEVMLQMHEAGAAVDPATVAARVRELGANVGVHASRRALMKLAGETPASASARRYAETVAAYGARRRLIVAGKQVIDAARDLAEPIAAVADTARELVDRAAEVSGSAAGPTQTLDEFLQGDTEMDWLVPGFIERGDRVLLVGPEGHGKSVMLRQWAVCASQGVDLWGDGDDYPPLRVLLVDCENGEKLLRRHLMRLYPVARRMAGPRFDPSRLLVESRPEGLDLVGRASDRAWLYAKLTQSRPDVLVIGPVYKLHAHDENRADEMRPLQVFLDRLRRRFGCALLMETHASHDAIEQRRIRPSGSRVWFRWPELLLGFLPADVESDEQSMKAYDLKFVRPARNGSVEMPHRVSWGTPSGLPWVANTW